MSPKAPLLYPGSKIRADESPGFLDFFSEHHTNRTPVVLCDRTSVKWPAGYTKDRAALWRAHRPELVKPQTKKAPRRSGAR